MRHNSAEVFTARPEPAAGARRKVARSARPAPPVKRTFLTRAVHSRANVLVRGDAAAARDIFEGACREGALHVLSAEALNREGMRVLSCASGPRGGWLLLEGVDALRSWAQVALLDVLESPPDLGLLVGIPRVISTSQEDLGTLVADGRFSRSLYLRLSTVRMDLSGAKARAGSGLAARGGARR